MADTTCQAAPPLNIVFGGLLNIVSGCFEAAGVSTIGGLAAFLTMFGNVVAEL